MKGPFLYNNWLAWQHGEPSCGAIEAGLFSDAHVTGELDEGYGPYRFINNIAIPEVIILRAEIHMPDLYSADTKTITTDHSCFHGGDLSDEAAALLSLSLGFRLKAGPITREFDPHQGDPRGRPVGYNAGFKSRPGKPSSGKLLPHMRGTLSLQTERAMKTLPDLDPAAAVALVRAARLYQEAVWSAEVEPSLSWVMLVSAIEVAAGFWRAAKDSSVDRLSEVRPDLARLLEECGGHELVAKVADKIADYMGATKKFTDFICEHRPSPLKVRPSEGAQVSWELNAMKRHLKKIYDYRSLALHAGTPFPVPMTMGPIGGASEILAEKPLGLMTAALGSTWKADDCPMHLHTFEHIVRESLGGWWRAGCRPAAPGPSSAAGRPAGT